MSQPAKAPSVASGVSEGPQASGAKHQASKIAAELAGLLQQLRGTTNPEQRQKLLAEIRAKQKSAVAEMEHSKPASTVRARFSEADIEAQIKKTAPPALAAGLLDRQKLMAALESYRQETQSLPAEQRSAAMAAWMKQHQAEMDKFHAEMRAGMAAQAASRPAVNVKTTQSQPPREISREEFQAGIAQIQQLYRTATPGERSRALRQWLGANRPKLQNPASPVQVPGEAAGKAGS